MRGASGQSKDPVRARKLAPAVGLAVAGLLAGTLLAEAACLISTTPVSFGSYDVFAVAPRDSTGSVTYRCGLGDVNVTIALDSGGAPDFATRRMLKGAEPLSYNLFLDPARTIVWGDGTGGTQVHSNPLPLPNQDITVTIYGRIPARQNVSAGTYTNVIVVTIMF